MKFSIIPFRYGRFYLVFQIFRFDIGFFHDRIDILLASLDSMLVEDLGNLGRAIQLMRIIVDLDDCFLGWAISLACNADIVPGSSCDDLSSVIFIAFEPSSNGRIVNFELLRDLGISKVWMIEHVLDHLFLEFFVILFCHFSFLLILEFKLFFL